MKKKYVVCAAVLGLLAGLLLYFFIPRSFSWAVGPGFDPERVDHVNVHISRWSDDVNNWESLDYSLSPEDAQQVLDLLEQRSWYPILDAPAFTGNSWYTPAMSDTVSLSWLQDDGSYLMLFYGIPPINMTSSSDNGIISHKVRTNGSTAFQQELLDRLLAMEPTRITLL